MAEQNKPFFDGVGTAREEEEVRDLFHQLMQEKPDEQATSVTQNEVVARVSPDESVLTDMPSDRAAEDMPESAGDAVVMQDDLPPLVFNRYEDDDEDDIPDDEDYYKHFILPTDDAEDDFDGSDEPRERRNPLLAFWNALCDNVPVPSDRFGEVMRKTVFWLSCVVLSGALTYILYNVWWLPNFTKDMYADIEENYHPEAVGTVDEGDYPEKMQLSFQMLYDRNDEVRGWLSYHAVGNQDFLNIEYPVMYSGDNEKYLTTDFNGNKNKNGALFFDLRANLDSPEDTNTSLIIYGHNMASGQMLAGLNKFIGNVNNARVASTLTMNTLFKNAQYKVFAVVMTDESAADKHYFNVRRTAFRDSADFDQYIDALRSRSLFDYPVDVQAGDELLLLSTCTVPSSAKITNGRLTVIARKVREGETAAVNTAAIVKNSDVIMPYAWYTKQNMDFHAYYVNGGTTTLPESTTTSVATTGTEESTDSSSGVTTSATSVTAGVTTTTAATIGVSTTTAATTAATTKAITTTATTATTATKGTTMTATTTLKATSTTAAVTTTTTTALIKTTTVPAQTTITTAASLAGTTATVPTQE